MRLAHAPIAFALVALVAGCGKMGGLETPPGSTYLRTYPASTSMPTPAPSPVSDTPPPAFTKSGAWIDPDTRLPRIDPRADQDVWSAINRPGTN